MINQSPSPLKIGQTLSSFKVRPLTSGILINNPALTYFHVPCCRIIFPSSQRKEK